MVFSIAELSAALPHAGGFFSFTRNAFGPTGGFVCGLTDAIEYVLTPAVIVYYIGGYMEQLVPGPPDVVWWIVFYVVFVGINVRGVELTLQVGLLVTALAIAVLVVFFGCVVAKGAFRSELLFNIEPDWGQTARGLPKGSAGAFAAIPFAIWFFLAIEQLPLAAEETHDVVRDMPKALIAGIATLLILSLMTLVLNSGVDGGAAAIARSNAPLADGFQAVLGLGTAAKALTLVAIAGLVASFHTVIYAYGRVLFALSRAGYIPRVISLTNSSHAPFFALLLGACVGFACTLVIKLTADTEVGAALLNMAVFGAVISYAMVLSAYIVLRIRRPDLPRPYRSPLGTPGALVGLILAIVSLAATFSVPDYRPAVVGVALFLLFGLAYFFAYSRHRLVAAAPEEENALLAASEKELVHH